MSRTDDLSIPRTAFDRRDDVQFVDVRESDEWSAGRIEGAVHIPLNDLLSGRSEGLDPGRPVVAYCSHGQRSEVARLMLEARGFEAYNLQGGVDRWLAEGIEGFSAPDGSPGRLV